MIAPSGRDQKHALPPESPYLWVETKAILGHLSISRATLNRLRQEGVLVEKRHYIKKNPMASRGVFLWNIQRCDLALDRI